MALEPVHSENTLEANDASNRCNTRGKLHRQVLWHGTRARGRMRHCRVIIERASFDLLSDGDRLVRPTLHKAQDSDCENFTCCRQNTSHTPSRSSTASYISSTNPSHFCSKVGLKPASACHPPPRSGTPATSLHQPAKDHVSAATRQRGCPETKHHARARPVSARSARRMRGCEMRLKRRLEPTYYASEMCWFPSSQPWSVSNMKVGFPMLGGFWFGLRWWNGRRCKYPGVLSVESRAGSLDFGSS